MERIRDYTVLDMEMTGLSPKTEKIIEIGVVRVRDGKLVSEMSCLVNPGREISEDITKLTGITDAMVQEGRQEDDAMEELLDFLGEDILVGQNIRFDYSFLAQWCVNRRRSIRIYSLDTLRIARVLLPQEASKKLEDLCTYYGVERVNAHRALDDAVETAMIFERMQQELLKQPELAEKLLKPVLLQYKAKRQTPATAHQIERLKEYRLVHGLTDEIDWSSLTRSEASRLQDRYYAAYGRSGTGKGSK